MSAVHDDIASDASSTQELLERARALKPLLARNAAQAEDARRIPEENIAALDEAGLFKITKPKRFGGYEVPFETKLKVSAILAEACPSTAWVVTLTNVCAWFTGLFSGRAQQDVWGDDARVRVCGVFAPTATSQREQGGQRVSGSWGYASGCLHSQWAVLGIPVMDDAGEQVDQGFALIPLSELRIEDTWFVAGMKGTARIRSSPRTSSCPITGSSRCPPHWITSTRPSSRTRRFTGPRSFPSPRSCSPGRRSGWRARR
jgi:3-hydroxy-9,10-secoandrosta-1,3,5(10)-triene-9,17-dione monooxygenase